MTYASFLAERPVFFWRDRFGHLLKFETSKYNVLGGCGKPVIYLYPETTQSVNVRVSPTGGMTVSDPAYGQGWNVTAHPDGTLDNAADGNTYPYLFWEGRADGLWQLPSRGFSVAQDDVSAFLDRSLSQLGLNAKETADFKEFWLPKFHGHPYYFITFHGNRLMDEIAPLDVTPRPDTVIRILMDFVGTDRPDPTVQPQRLSAPPRKGFTVIEWGGVLR